MIFADIDRLRYYLIVSTVQFHNFKSERISVLKMATNSKQKISDFVIATYLEKMRQQL